MLSLNENFKNKAAQLKLLGLDVDGVLSDGKITFSAQGDELKSFCTLDGHGIKMLQSKGITVAIITGRNSPIVARRARDLGIEHIVQGREDKRVALDDIRSELGLSWEECAYMGDDLPDLSAMKACALSFTVPNAHAFIKKHAQFCTEAYGGQGAVREVCDSILDARGQLTELLDQYLKQ